MGSKELTKLTIQIVASQSEVPDTNSLMDAIDTQIHVYDLQFRFPLKPEALHIPHVPEFEDVEAMHRALRI